MRKSPYLNLLFKDYFKIYLIKTTAFKKIMSHDTQNMRMCELFNLVENIFNDLIHAFLEVSRTS